MIRSPACILALVICAATSIAAAGCSSADTRPFTRGGPGGYPPRPDTETNEPAPTGEPTLAKPSALADAIDALFTDAEAKDAFSGSVVVVDAGETVLEKGFGSADRSTKRKNGPDTIFRIGSVSKQFTAAAILALVQDGRLSLTDPVASFFPDYPKENLVQGGAEVTIHHLLSHTSGLPDPGKTEPYNGAVWQRAIDPWEQVDFVKGQPLVAAPGGAFAYVNFNFLLAALIVERTTGKPYERFLRERFFEPLGMKDTGTRLPGGAAPRAARGYHQGSGGELVVFADDPGFNDGDVSFAYGSGQIYSTVQDLARWDRALTGDAVLSAPQRNRLFTPNLDGYGYGWAILEQGGVTIEAHNGALSPLGFTALIARAPSKDRFVAYVANMDTALLQPLELDAKVAALIVQ